MIDMKAKWQWEPRYMWVGVFWKWYGRGGGYVMVNPPRFTKQQTLILYICLVPCLPLVVTLRRHWRSSIDHPKAGVELVPWLSYRVRLAGGITSLFPDREDHGPGDGEEW